MRGGKLQRCHKSDKKTNKTQENSDVAKTTEHGEDGNDEETASGEANVIASVNQNTLLEGLTLLSEELKDFKQDMRRDLSEFKNDVKKTMILSLKTKFCESCRVKTLASRRRKPGLQTWNQPAWR